MFKIQFHIQLHYNKINFSVLFGVLYIIIREDLFTVMALCVYKYSSCRSYYVIILSHFYVLDVKKLYTEILEIR